MGTARPLPCHLPPSPGSRGDRRWQLEANLSSLTLCTGIPPETIPAVLPTSMEEETTMTLSGLYPPSCTVTHSVEGADLLLKCSAYANPEAELSWSLRDTPLDGKAVDGTGNQQTSILRLELSDNSTGLYYCHASNSLG